MPRLVGIDKTGVPIGQIVELANAALPAGLLPCDGAAVSRTTYAALFAAIGTAYGVGDGSTTFNVPDRRGRVAIGDGTGTGLTARTRGQMVGAEVHILAPGEIPGHSHPINDPGHSHSIPSRSGNNGNTVFAQDLASGSRLSAGLTGSAGDTTHSSSSSGAGITTTQNNAGGGGSHNNMQPSLVCKFGIAYV